MSRVSGLKAPDLLWSLRCKRVIGKLNRGNRIPCHAAHYSAVLPDSKTVAGIAGDDCAAATILNADRSHDLVRV